MGCRLNGMLCTSDIRLKSDIRDSGTALDWLKDMRIRNFTIGLPGWRRPGAVEGAEGLRSLCSLRKTSYSCSQERGQRITKQSAQIEPYGGDAG
jgi:hypothetical protein